MQHLKSTSSNKNHLAKKKLLLWGGLLILMVGLAGYFSVLRRDLIQANVAVNSVSPDTEQPEETMDSSEELSPSANEDVETHNDQGVQDDVPPRLQVAMSTSSDTILALFNEPINPDTVSINSFEIMADDQETEELTVISYTLNDQGNIITLETDPQVPGKSYVMLAKEVQDNSGNQIMAEEINQLSIVGFSSMGTAPQIISALSTSHTSIGLTLSADIDPRSISIGMAPSDIVILEEGTGISLEATNLNMISANALEIETDPQAVDQDYILIVSGNITAYDQIPAEGNLAAFFKGYNEEAGLNPSAGSDCFFPVDIVCDQEVNFKDFGVFSYYYLAKYFIDEKGDLVIIRPGDEEASNEEEDGSIPTDGSPFGSGSSGPTVPTNSVPASGDIIDIS